MHISKQLPRIALSVLAVLTGSAAAKDWPTLAMMDPPYESVCTPGEWQQLQPQILKLAGKRKPAALVQLLRTYYCGDGPSATRTIQSHVANRVRVTDDSLGELSYSWTTPLDYKPLAGSAWRVDIRSDGELIYTSYTPNEGCGSDLTLRYRFFRWQIFEAGGACC